MLSDEKSHCSRPQVHIEDEDIDDFPEILGDEDQEDMDLD